MVRDSRFVLALSYWPGIHCADTTHRAASTTATLFTPLHAR